MLNDQAWSSGLTECHKRSGEHDGEVLAVKNDWGEEEIDSEKRDTPPNLSPQEARELDRRA